MTQTTEHVDDAEPTGRLRSTAETLSGVIRRVPFSVALAVVLLGTTIAAGTAVGSASDATASTWAAGVLTTIEAGRWWTVGSALVIAFDPFQLVFGVLASLLLLGIAERRMGTWRTIIAFVVTGVLGVALGTVVQWLGSLAGEWWATGTATDLTLDPLTGIVGALMASTAFMGTLWRRRIRLVTVAFILVFVLYDGDSSNVYRLVAAVAGYLLGAVLARDASTLSARRSSHRETRTLVAAIVAVTAVGPIVALVNRSELTPFAFGSYLSRDDPLELATVMARCGGSTASDACITQLALLSAQGFGMFLLSFVPVLLLLLAAWGLRNGRRFAWWLAIAVNLAILLFARTAFDVTVTTADVDDGTWTVFDLGELVVWTLAVLALPIGIIVMLIATRRHFQLRAPRRSVAQFAMTVGVTFVVLAGLYFVAGLTTLGEYWPAAIGSDLLLDTLKRFVPPHFLAVVDPIVLPGHDLTSVLYQVVGPLFWAVFIVAAVRLMSRSRAETAAKAADDERLRELLHRNGGGTLGFMATWPGNVIWFGADGDSAVAYRVVNGVAITMSDPICPPNDAGRVIREFAAFCDANSWVPVFYSVHPQYLPVFDELGWQHMSVGEETLVRTTGLELAGKPWQKVRQALNRGIKEGMTTVWTSWNELPLTTVAEINAISEEWVAEKELPEMGFTLGGMEELKDPEVRLMLAVGTDGRLQAVTSWLPVYRDGAVVGWTIDFMRRADGSMNGVMEFLIASAALHMKETGAEVLSLSGAPLASKPLVDGETPSEPTVMTRLLDWLAATLEPAYGFSSLFRFKAKFNPEYETISMAYPDPLALPTIGLAIGRAYLPEVSPAEAVALVKTLTA